VFDGNMVSWKRILKTASSERFLAVKSGKDAAAIDLHYLDDGTVAGTVCLLKDAGWSEDNIPNFLQQIDEDLLPNVDLQQGNLIFTVVFGEVVGNFDASPKPI